MSVSAVNFLALLRRTLIRHVPVLAFLALVACSAEAHESRPIYILLQETAPQHYLLKWKTPVSLALVNTPSVSLPTFCKPLSRPIELRESSGVLRQRTYHCAESLEGKQIIVTYPQPNPSLSSLVEMRSATARHIAVLGPQESRWTVPSAATDSFTAPQYLALGITHILNGVDHLLFLACLLWIAGTTGRLFLAITGFTVAHSITLTFAALDIVRVPVPPTEVAIALSIAFLAAEVVKGPRATLCWRHPFAASAAFGLLHGFGFATALKEIGLPRSELIEGLLCFNLGVEIGQAMFVVASMGLVRLAQAGGFALVSNTKHARTVRIVTSYAVGTLAIFWMMERGAAFFR